MRRTRADFTVERQCTRCRGTGTMDCHLRHIPVTCSFCSGSGLTRPPKFRVVCECGEQQPRYAHHLTGQKWMHDHMRSHIPQPSATTTTSKEPANEQ